MGRRADSTRHYIPSRPREAEPYEEGGPQERDADADRPEMKRIPSERPEDEPGAKRNEDAPAQRGAEADSSQPELVGE